jgi:CDP-glucose 4,6-dehydratase
LVRESYIDPLGTYETNVLGVAYLLDAIRQLNSVRSVLVVTSDKTYENMEWDRGYRETDALGGHDPYSSSKACAEMVTSAYRRSFFSGDINCQIATARAGNVIGGGDQGKDRLVPDLLAGFASGNTVHIRNPHATRPWQHVLDPLHGYLILMQKMYEKEGFDTAWNFGPDDAGSKRVDWLADSLAKSWGVEGAWQSDDSEQPHEAVMLALDCSQARTRLGWRPRLDISQALALTVSWTKARIAQEDMSKVTEEQIRQYLNDQLDR